jgi:predicted amidohydrolase
MTCLVRVLEYGIPILSVNNAKWSLKLGDEEVCESCDVGSFPPEGGGSIIVSPPLFKSIGDVEDWFRVGRSCEEWIIKEAGDGEEILVAELDLKGIRRARQLWSDYFS